MKEHKPEDNTAPEGLGPAAQDLWFLARRIEAEARILKSAIERTDLVGVGACELNLRDAFSRHFDVAIGGYAEEHGL